MGSFWFVVGDWNAHTAKDEYRSIRSWVATGLARTPQQMVTASGKFWKLPITCSWIPSDTFQNVAHGGIAMETGTNETSRWPRSRCPDTHRKDLGFERGYGLGSQSKNLSMQSPDAWDTTEKKAERRQICGNLASETTVDSTPGLVAY